MSFSSVILIWSQCNVSYFVSQVASFGARHADTVVLIHIYCIFHVLSENGNAFYKDSFMTVYKERIACN